MNKALQAGASVFFTYHRNETKARELTEKGALGFRLDLSSPGGLETFQKEFRDLLSARGKQPLHVLIHNAAVTDDSTLQNMKEEQWDRVLEVNLKAPYSLTKKLLSLLFKTEPSKVFFITSRAAVQGVFGAANYAAAKAGLIALSKSLAQELGRKRVLVNCVNPGFMKSAMTESLPPAVFERNIQQSVIGKISDPEEVADFLVFLCGDAMSQVSGQTFHFESRKI